MILSKRPIPQRQHQEAPAQHSSNTSCYCAAQRMPSDCQSRLLERLCAAFTSRQAQPALFRTHCGRLCLFEASSEPHKLTDFHASCVVALQSQRKHMNIVSRKSFLAALHEPYLGERQGVPHHPWSKGVPRVRGASERRQNNFQICCF